MRHLLRTPVFASEESSLRARIFHRVMWLIMATSTILLGSILVVQPELTVRALIAIALVDGLGLVLIWVNATGRTALASWMLVGGLITLVSLMALHAGGIRSPGVTFYFVFVLMSGVLLGQRAGMFTGAVCAGLALGLVALETSGHLPAPTVLYGPGALWLLNATYLAVVLILLQLATGAMKSALGRAEAELAERRVAERRLEMALDAGTIGTWDYTVSSRSFIGDSRAFALLDLGPPGRAVSLAEWAATLHPDDAPSALAAVEELTSGARPSARLEYRIVRRDGTLREMDVAARAITDATGRVVNLAGTVIDATDRKAAERHREDLVSNLAERVKELGLLHAAMRVLQDDRAFGRNVVAEIVRMMPGAWKHHECCEARITFGDIDERTPGWTSSPWRQAATFSTSAGTGVVEVIYTADRPPADDGPFLAEERDLINSLAEILGTYIQRHHTEARRRALELQLRQSQKMDALGQMAGGVAHDFNNILTAIGGNAELVADDIPIGHRSRPPLDDILSAHARAVDLVRRILTFSRKGDSVKRPIQLAAVVDEAVQLLRVSEAKSVTVTTRHAEHLPLVMADSTQIHQIVMNLGTNAAHAMKETGGQLSFVLSIESFATDEDVPLVELRSGRYVRLDVADTGTGIPADVVERLFEPFFTTKGEAGTGLGLSVVHGIVHEHGGAITVDSTVGLGTTFTVYLPAVESQA